MKTMTIWVMNIGHGTRTDISEYCSSLKLFLYFFALPKKVTKNSRPYLYIGQRSQVLTKIKSQMQLHYFDGYTRLTDFIS